MNKPQRKPSFGNSESLQGTSRLSSAMKGPRLSSAMKGPRPSSSMKGPRPTPLLRTTKRMPLSAAKTNQRESYIGTANHHAMKDQRPLSDRPYMKKCIVEIIQLLEKLNYPNALYLKMFNPPSSKDYQRVFEFLTLQILGSFRILGRPDEEMLKVAKDLGYPFNLSKSNLNNVGAMSSWPQALGVLHWIAELVKYKVGAEDAVNETLSLDPKKKIKHDFFYKEYQEFMLGNDGPFGELVDEMKESVDALDSDAMKEYERLQAVNNRLLAKHDEKMKEKESMRHLGETVANTRVNIGKIKHYLSQCDAYLNSLKVKTEQFQQSIANLKEEKAQINETICQLKSTIAQQQLSPSDIQQIALDKQRLKDAMNAVTSRAEELKDSKWNLEIQSGKLMLQLDSKVDQFNITFDKLRNSLPHIKDLLPSDVMKSFAKGDFHLLVGNKGLDVNRKRIVSCVQPLLSTLHSNLIEIHAKLEGAHYNAHKRVLQDKEMIVDLTETKEKFTQQLDKLTDEAVTQKEESKLMEESIQSQSDVAKRELEQLRIAKSESFDDLTQTLHKAKSELETFKLASAKEISDFKQYLKDLAKVVKQWQQRHHGILRTQIEMLDSVDEQIAKELEQTKSKVQEMNVETEQLRKDIGKLRENIDDGVEDCNAQISTVSSLPVTDAD